MDFLTVLNTQLIPSTLALCPSLTWNDQARVLIGAICLQESGGRDVQQEGNGPADGYPQFEVEAIREILENAATAKMAMQAVHASGILDFGSEQDAQGNQGAAGPGVSPLSPSQIATVVHAKFLNFPTLQIVFARLMLWANPNPLPELGDCDDAWNYYDSTWHPGRPRRETWDAYYAQSLNAVQPQGDSPS